VGVVGSDMMVMLAAANDDFSTTATALDLVKTPRRANGDGNERRTPESWATRPRGDG